MQETFWLTYWNFDWYEIAKLVYSDCSSQCDKCYGAIYFSFV